VQRSNDVTIIETRKPSLKDPVGAAAADTVQDILDRIPDHVDAASGMLPAECYTSPEFFEFERSEIFSRSWICVGRIEQVANPGDCISAQPAGEPILVTRTNTGEIRAMAAICRHRGQVIPCVENQKTLRCPLHFWTYDLEGKLIGAPRMEKEEIAALRKNTARAMGDARLHIKQRHVDNCTRADPAYGAGVAKALGLKQPELVD
jgi:nitrite reductase/ring-hydroxylating ferredoxin subunit